MKQLVVEVPDEMLGFVRELLERLHLQVMPQEESTLSPQEIEELERREQAHFQNPAPSWEDMENSLKKKYGREPL